MFKIKSGEIIHEKGRIFFCVDKNIDPVASNVFNYLQNNNDFIETKLIIDEFPVMEYNNGDYFLFVRLTDVLSHNYIKYLPVLNQHFKEFDVAGVVNWHEGIHAPDRILTIHSTGDAPSGFFSKSSPAYFKNIFCSLEQNRVKYQLDNFKVMTEATHWSGVSYKQPPELLDRI
jgi:D-tyrosyl-tRNA(Tyr) deacylase